MTASTHEGVRRTGRPRDERLDVEITSAALDVLAEGGFERFSVEEVAQRARVAKTTVYRRFPCRRDLIAGALGRLNDEEPAPPAPGHVRDRLVDLLGRVRRYQPDGLHRRIVMHASTERLTQPELAGLVESLVLVPRRRLLREVLQEGIAQGELRADLDLDAAVPVLVGPMLYLGAWGAAPAAGAVSVEAVVDLVLSGLTPARDS